ncbi:MAG TPA: GntR family transcriptional regulator, partial [Geminicoccaceae bacterium]|nr:GntR family transcriptional regulator [Geminicoccaceae bacterium]
MAVERLRDAIISGDLALGEQLSEAELARRLGISKTPVREA